MRGSRRVSCARHDTNSGVKPHGHGSEFVEAGRAHTTRSYCGRDREAEKDGAQGKSLREVEAHSHNIAQEVESLDHRKRPRLVRTRIDDADVDGRLPESRRIRRGQPAGGHKAGEKSAIFLEHVRAQIIDTTP